MADKKAAIEGLRTTILTSPASKFGITPLASGVWGVLMEFAVADSWVTLVAVLDGTTSLYFGGGGGIVGSGQKDPVRRANKHLLEAAGSFDGALKKTDVFPTPTAGHVHFYVLKADGVYASADVDEAALREYKDDLAPLYCDAQDVITQIRLANPPPKK
jgi:hypothetical protein